MKNKLNCAESTSNSGLLEDLSDAVILIAEDDRDLLASLKLRCESIGCTVIAVDDALSALSCADFANPSLIILDVQMPNGNGLAVCEMLATSVSFADIPVIVHTGKNDSETVSRCVKFGAHHVTKSTNSWSDLEPLIRNLLADRKHRYLTHMLNVR